MRFLETLSVEGSQKRRSKP